MKNVMIPYDLFMNLIKYHLLEVEEVLPAVKKGLENKMDSMVMHDIYSQYKTDLTEEEREKARKKYLDRKGVKDNFRW